MDHIIIPTAEALRIEIRRKANELNALRKLLRMADAATQAGIASLRAPATMPLTHDDNGKVVVSK